MIKLILIKTYKGFETQFYLTFRVKQFLEDKQLPLDSFLEEELGILSGEFWYEGELFGLLNPNLDSSWTPQKEQRTKFSVIVDTVIMCWDNGKEQLLQDEVKYKQEQFLAEITLGSRNKSKKEYGFKYKVVVR